MFEKKLEWKIEKMKVKDMIPYDRNPRIMSKEMAEKLEESIEQDGLFELPIVDLDNTIVAGNQRYKVLMKMGKGEEEIDVIMPNRSLKNEEFLRICLRSNKIDGDWDYDMLANNFDVDYLSDIGFDKDKMVDFNPVDDDDIVDNEKSKKQTCPECGYEFE